MTMQQLVPPGFGVAIFHHAVAGVAHSMSTSLGFDWSTKVAADAAFEQNGRFKTALMSNGTRLSPTGRYLGVTCFLTLPNGDVHIEEIAENIAGTQGSPACPPNCALLVDKRTGIAGKSNRGRFFFPSCYLIEGEVDDTGVIGSGVMAGHIATLDAWYDNLITSGIPPFLMHQYGTYINRDGETVTVAQKVPTPITQFVPVAKIGTQRGRLR